MRFTRVKLNISEHIDYYSRFHPTSFTLKSLLDFAREGNVADSFKFLRTELLIRWSHMRKEMNYLPVQLTQTASFRMVTDGYDQTYREVFSFKDSPSDGKTLEKFNETLMNIRRRHADVVPTMAQAYKEFEQSGDVSLIEKSRIQYFYDRFFMNRIGVRTLVYQHTQIFGDELPQHPQQIGIIDPKLDVASVVQDAHTTAKHLFQSALFPAIPIEISSQNFQDHQSNKVTIVYIPSYLYHIVFELLKNAIRATVDRYGREQKEYPAIRVLIVKGQEDLTIEIRDQGIGIPRSKLSNLFQYSYSTAPKPGSKLSLNGSTGAPLAGLGYGLPLSRLYARYFQGNLAIASIENIGTSAYVSLKATPETAREVLPVFNKTRYSYTTKKGSDWTTQMKH